MENLYGGIKMTWLKVIVFAIITGVYTGVIMLVPALHDTSFQDIGITYEWWVIFAVIVVVNCQKNWEAMLKCFVFFLISQPLVYTTEVIWGGLTIDLALLYYGYWFVPTLLTIPGGLIAYYCKKQNLSGSIILGMGNTIQVFFGLFYAKAAIRSFPNHLLSSIVCFGSILVMGLSIQKKTKNRIVAIFLPVIMVTLLGILAKMTGRTFI